MAIYLQNGDTVQSGYVVKTLNEKLYIKPGITSNRECTMPAAETLLYWTKAKKEADTVTGVSGVSGPGHKQTFAEKALVKKSLSLSKAEQINGVIPGVNIGLVSADQVNSHVVQDVIEAANKINRDFVGVLKGGAVFVDETGADYNGKDVYEMLLNLAAEYKMTNKSEYMEPTACFVSPKLYAQLLKNNLIYFKDNKPVSVFDFEIIECPDLGTVGEGAGIKSVAAIMLNQVAMVSGIAWQDVRTFDAAPLGYAGGTAYIGEMAYVNALTDLGAVAYDASTYPAGVKPILGLAF